MQYTRVSLLSLAALLLAAAHSALAAPADAAVAPAAAAPAAAAPEIVEVVLAPEALAVEAEADDADRDKRALEPIVVKHFGKKNYLLNLIFGKINQAIDHKTALVDQLDKLNIQKNAAWGITGKSQPCTRPCSRRRPASSPRPAPEDEDVAELDRNGVSLDIPSEVFGASFTVLNNIGMSLGRVIENSAMRTQRFVEALKPVLSSKFGVSTRGRSIRDSVASNTIDRR